MTDRPMNYADELRALALRAPLTDADQARVAVIAAELQRLHQVEQRVLVLLRATIDSDSVAAIGSALDELHAWALGAGELRDAPRP
jgi:hypothetical protein